ncbi:phosphatase PAP2 family protein [Candidatus Poribacteria bacterium]|nr:phosphatase PAP2 family protein [Candidatus Poribacteria bacterium]
MQTLKQFSTRHVKHVILFYVLLFSLFTSGIDVNADNFLTRWDQQFFDRIYDAPPRSEPMWTVMEVGTEFGHYRSIMGFSILLMAYGNEDRQNTGRLLSSAYISTGVLTYGVKQLVRRKRPLDDMLGNPSMPSGHTSIAFSAATILGYEYPKWRIPLYIGAGLVGFSRIYLGRHYTSDVLVGAAIGTAMGVVVWHNRVTLLQWKF